MVKWSNITIERPHREFMKQLYQAKYFNHFISLNRNATLMPLTVNGIIDWKLSFFYFNYNERTFSPPSVEVEAFQFPGTENR